MTDVQYFNQIKKGSTVSYGNKDYRVQDDGKGFLHIIVIEEGKRKKISIASMEHHFFEPGSKADYIFNGWYKMYTEQEFYSFASAEIAWQQF